MNEKHVCPDRANNPGPWTFLKDYDEWETNRWDEKEHVVWNWPWKPRTCSYCGGIHPDDAIKLISEGWTIEGTGKNYKRYLNVPGYMASMVEYRVNVNAGVDPIEALKNIPKSPVPLVKVYLWHFNEEQLKKL